MQAAEKLRITAQEHYRLKIADGIIPVSTCLCELCALSAYRSGSSFVSLLKRHTFFLTGITSFLVFN